MCILSMLELFMKKVNKDANNAPFKLKTNLKAGPNGNGRGNGFAWAKGRDPDSPTLNP